MMEVVMILYVFIVLPSALTLHLRLAGQSVMDYFFENFIVEFLEKLLTLTHSSTTHITTNICEINL